MVVRETDTATAGRKSGQINEESLIEFDRRVTGDNHVERAAGLTGGDRQRAGVVSKINARSRSVIGSRKINGDAGINRLRQGDGERRCLNAAVTFRDGHVADRHVGAVVVRDRASSLVIGDADVATAGGEVREIHEEALVEFDQCVAADRDADRATGLTGVDRERAAGAGVITAGRSGVIGGRVIDADVGIDRLAE